MSKTFRCHTTTLPFCLCLFLARWSFWSRCIHSHHRTVSSRCIPVRLCVRCSVTLLSLPRTEASHTPHLCPLCFQCPYLTVPDDTTTKAQAKQQQSNSKNGLDPAVRGRRRARRGAGRQGRRVGTGTPRCRFVVCFTVMARPFCCACFVGCRRPFHYQCQRGRGGRW